MLFSGRSLTAILVVTLCITVGACGETSITGEDPAQLTGLSIAPAGELAPPFSRTETSYAATVPTDLPSLVVTANTDVADSTITINGLEIPAGANQSVSLGPPGAPTPIEVAVLSANGEAKTYVITVTRLAKCAVLSGEDCCPQDYQERECGSGSCGKQARLCTAAGKWEEWSACGVNSARAGQVCRVKAPGNPCDPVEVCGVAVDCPADYVEVPLEGRPGCWQNIEQYFEVKVACAGFGCVPNYHQYAALTASHLCVARGFKTHVPVRGISNWQQAGGDIELAYWNGAGFATVKHYDGLAMLGITCLK